MRGAESTEGEGQCEGRKGENRETNAGAGLGMDRMGEAQAAAAEDGEVWDIGKEEEGRIKGRGRED